MSAGAAGLVAMAEREVALARAGRWEELAAAMEDRARAASALPAPSAADRPMLERLQALHAEVVALLELGRTAAAHELRRIGRGRTTVRGYGAALPSMRALAGGRVDAGA